MLMGFDKAEQRMKVLHQSALRWRHRLIHVIIFVRMSPVGPDGETGRPSLWRGLRESEEPLSKTAIVSGDGEKEHI